MFCLYFNNRVNFSFLRYSFNNTFFCSFKFLFIIECPFFYLNNAIHNIFIIFFPAFKLYLRNNCFFFKVKCQNSIIEFCPYIIKVTLIKINFNRLINIFYIDIITFFKRKHSQGNWLGDVYKTIKINLFYNLCIKINTKEYKKYR